MPMSDLAIPTAICCKCGHKSHVLCAGLVIQPSTISLASHHPRSFNTPSIFTVRRTNGGVKKLTLFRHVFAVALRISIKSVVPNQRL